MSVRHPPPNPHPPRPRLTPPPASATTNLVRRSSSSAQVTNRAHPPVSTARLAAGLRPNAQPADPTPGFASCTTCRLSLPASRNAHPSARELQGGRAAPSRRTAVRRRLPPLPSPGTRAPQRGRRCPTDGGHSTQHPTAPGARAQRGRRPPARSQVSNRRRSLDAAPHRPRCASRARRRPLARSQVSGCGWSLGAEPTSPYGSRHPSAARRPGLRSVSVRSSSGTGSPP
ncbi:hypothetical protein H4W81_006098 [Nonomuraea africana]|uniref:Uncharacterized protein n=1 Tax=Nonomuraea africana TaxID=46171 RepID=A0ABR9KMR5_9ACTN|nr:hypothetical protein [Nonomuraea africana]